MHVLSVHPIPRAKLLSTFVWAALFLFPSPHFPHPPRPSPRRQQRVVVDFALQASLRRVETAAEEGRMRAANFSQFSLFSGASGAVTAVPSEHSL